MVSLCCCGQGPYTALKFGIALHYRYGEAVFERNDCLANIVTGATPNGAKRYRAIGRRFRRVLMSYSVYHDFPDAIAGRPPNQWTVYGTHRTTYNRFTGVREEQFGEQYYPYFYATTRGLSVYPPYGNALWTLQTQTNSVTSSETSVAEIVEQRYASYRGEGYMRIEMRHDFEDEATQDQAIEDVQRLLDYIDLPNLPWNFPDPAETRIPGHIYSSTYFSRFTSTIGDIGYSGGSSIVNGYVVPGRTRYLDRPIQPPDMAKTGVVPDLWAGICFNPKDQSVTGPVSDEFYQLGSIPAVKTLVATKTGTYYGNVVGSRVNERLGRGVCALLAAGATPLFIGATPNDLKRYPDIAHIHDWKDMTLSPAPGFLQVSRTPC